MKSLKTSFAILASSLSTMMPQTAVYAATSTDKYEQEFNSAAKPIVVSIVSIMKQLVRWVGVVMLVWGAILFVMSFRDEDTEKKHRAITLAMSGLGMTLVSFLIDPIMDAAMPTGSGSNAGTNT